MARHKQNGCTEDAPIHTQTHKRIEALRTIDTNTVEASHNCDLEKQNNVHQSDHQQPCFQLAGERSMRIYTSNIHTNNSQ